jgi:3-dehydroquinate dehydratase/shikimate dehydrogenase
VIGDPVGHSLSPLIQNRAFRSLGINAVFLPFLVPRGELPEFLEAFNGIPVQGYSVTIPHKELAASVGKEREEAVDLIGAANTLVRTAEGWKVYNTDAKAAVESLSEHLPPTPDQSASALYSRTVLILGAGGVARAVAHALHRESANLTIANRTPERGQRLAQEVGCRFVEWMGRHNVLCDTLINCTSVGVHPNVDESPIHSGFLKSGLMVFETIYTPETTLLVKEARAHGCHVLTGVDMFVRQAALQFKLFTGQEAPVELMNNVVRRALSPIRMEDTD